jgi:fibrillarin-like pre-rRNA processing protein
MAKLKAHKVEELFYDEKDRLYTQSLVPGKIYFDERVVKVNGQEYREFEPGRSKLAAAIRKGNNDVAIRRGSIILYLGSSHGYTCSFVSDMIGKEGIIFAVDPAPRVMRDLVFLSEDRNNIVPLLVDANHPETYVDKACQADLVFQDVAQRNQAEIFIKNCETFLKKGGYGLLAVKARSIDAKKPSKQIFQEVRSLVERRFKVIDFRLLDPFERDHCMIMIQKNQ